MGVPAYVYAAWERQRLEAEQARLRCELHLARVRLALAGLRELRVT